MSLAEEYQRQFNWRSWNLVFNEVPMQAGQTVLDLGCGVGDLTRELAARGCKVIGLDENQELLDVAIAKKLPNCEFRTCDLRKDAGFGISVDGIWCSFVAAYFTNVIEFLSRWAHSLHAGGWIAITEIDDLFGHEPLSPRARRLFQRLADDALAAGRYDFHMGGKLRSSLEQVGFVISRELTVPDRELSFQGAATPEVVDAWRKRLQRMAYLRALCGSEFPSVQEDFLSCLSHPEHVSKAKVVICVATKID